MALEMKYFVLKPRGDSPHAKAARAAMLAYARVIGEHDPELARELGEWVNREESRLEATFTSDPDGVGFYVNCDRCKKAWFVGAKWFSKPQHCPQCGDRI